MFFQENSIIEEEKQVNFLTEEEQAVRNQKIKELVKNSQKK
jgi:hypothetical protein